MAPVGHVFLDTLILGADFATGCTFVSVFMQLWNAGEATGLSLQTLVAVVAVRFFHISSYHFGLHYKPMAFGVEIFYFDDVVNCALGVLCVLFFLRSYGTYEKIKDNFGVQIIDRYECLRCCGPLQNYRQMVGSSVLYVLVFFVGKLWYHIKEAGNPDGLLGHYMSFYEAMSALALIPQLWMFVQDRRVQPLLANFVVFTAVHKLLVLIFWITYPWVLGGPSPANRHVQMAFETLNLLILSDFLICWGRSKLRGLPEVHLDLEMSYTPSKLTDDENYITLA